MNVSPSLRLKLGRRQTFSSPRSSLRPLLAGGNAVPPPTDGGRFTYSTVRSLLCGRHRHHLSSWHKSQSSGEEGEEEGGTTAVRTTCSVSRTCLVFPEEASKIHRFSKGSSHITVYFGFEIKDKLLANNFFTTNWQKNPPALLCTWYAGHPFCIHFTRHSLGRRERKWLTEHKRRGGRGKSVTIRISVYICISGMGGMGEQQRDEEEEASVCCSAFVPEAAARGDTQRAKEEAGLA